MSTKPVQRRIRVKGTGKPEHAPVTIIVDLSLYERRWRESDYFLPGGQWGIILAQRTRESVI
jgi:hypothetical protein